MATNDSASVLPTMRGKFDKKKVFRTERGSNTRPRDLQSLARTTELSILVIVEALRCLLVSMILSRAMHQIVNFESLKLDVSLRTANCLWSFGLLVA